MASVYLESTEFESLAKEVLSRASVLHFRARGVSMWPFIHDGDIVEVRSNNGAFTHRYDIVMCRNINGHLVVHRILDIETRKEITRLLIKGDNLQQNDGYIQPEDILGRVVATERQGRRIRLDSRWSRLKSNFWIKLTQMGKQIKLLLIFIKNFIVRKY